MELVFDNITLRDYVLSDVEDEIRWTNEETEWFRSEAPWMMLEPVDADELRADMIAIMESMPDNAIRWRFEIDVNGKHIGLVSSYYLDGNYESVPWNTIDQSKNAVENNAIRTLGIEICEMDYWGIGIGGKALTALMEYYRSLGEDRFLLETWSGNCRMLGCARKLGFVEVMRRPGVFIVEGKEYDEIVLERNFHETDMCPE